MKINNAIAPHFSFKSLIPKYNRNGFTYFPINYTPSDFDMNDAVDLTVVQKPQDKGSKGEIYYWGNCLAIKKFYPKNKYDMEKEACALYDLQETPLLTGNIQKGEYAFISPQNQYYLVTLKMQGRPVNAHNNKFNNANLTSLMNTLKNLDSAKQFNFPSKIKSGEHDFSDRVYRIPLHYDLAPGNILISDSRADIVDFENLNCINLADEIKEQKRGFRKVDCNYSDIPGIQSNLRCFEYKTLTKYIKNFQRSFINSPRDFFKDYLKYKSLYYLNIAKHCMQEINKSENINSKDKKALLYMARHANAHAKVLSNPSRSVVRAEAKKIQIASFIYAQSQYDRLSGDKINVNFIDRYVENARQEFYEQKINETSNEKALYFSDCCELLKDWSGIEEWMEYQRTMQKYENFTQYELFMSKLTNQNPMTIDLIIS